MRIYPFDALRPPPERAADVACVPYDVVSRDEARELVDRKPWSFLRVVRPDVNMAPGSDIYAAEAYLKAREVFEMFQAEGALVRDGTPALYVYRLQMGAHVQHGIVTCCGLADVDAGVIRRHETTRDDKLNDRVRLIEALGAHSGPVYLTYRDKPAIDELVAECERQPALFDFTAHAGVRHTAWKVGAAQALVSAFEGVSCCYVADGHHRLAAAGEISRRLAAAGDGTAATVRGCDLFLGVLFPAGQLQILPYNRCVRDLNGLSVATFLETCARDFEVTADWGGNQPAVGQVGMYLDGKWYLLSRRPGRHTARSPVAELDVSLLQDRLLGPVLGIDDPRKNERILFVGGIRGRSELVKMVDSGKAAVAFLMHPVSLEEMMSIADAGMIMPPKSTWFEPKLKSGLFVHTF